MATLTASFYLIRWGLLSAIAMFLASTLRTKCRQNRRYLSGLLCSGVGIAMSCWFVTGLMGISLGTLEWHQWLEHTRHSLSTLATLTANSWPSY